jgi:hypothetical protein
VLRTWPVASSGGCTYTGLMSSTAPGAGVSTGCHILIVPSSEQLTRCPCRRGYQESRSTAGRPARVLDQSVDDAALVRLLLRSSSAPHLPVDEAHDDVVMRRIDRLHACAGCQVPHLMLSHSAVDCCRNLQKGLIYMS